MILQDYGFPPKKEFLKWLASLPANKQVGTCQDPTNCPIVYWFVARNEFGPRSGDEIHVTKKYTWVKGTGHLRNDPWMAAFVDIMDDPGHENFPSRTIIAGKLLEVLNDAVARHAKTFRRRRAAAIHFLDVGDQPGYKRKDNEW